MTFHNAPAANPEAVARIEELEKKLRALDEKMDSIFNQVEAMEEKVSEALRLAKLALNQDEDY